jgi:DNA gyrase/topoisomerase IV subunit A
MQVPLVSGRGNFGSRANDSPANFRYTEARLSTVGAVVLAAESGDSAPVPVGLINGNVHQEGTRPPFRPAAVLAALRAVIAHPGLPDQELTEIVGPPVFPTGHTGRGDLAALAAGRETPLRLTADVTIADDGRRVIIEHIPFGATTDDAASDITGRANMYPLASEHPRPGLSEEAGLPIADFRDETDSRYPDGRFACVVAQGIPPGELRDKLLDVYGVYTIVRAKLPRPLPAMIRDWITAHGAEDVAASLTALEQAL